MSTQLDHQSLNGLTLIEILVAMAIFSVIASMGYQGLNNIVTLQKEQRRIQGEQEDLQRVLLIMARDFYQIVPRGIRDNTGKRKHAVSFDSNSDSIEFTRSGNAHPIVFNLSQFLRVGYVLEGDELYRQHWVHLDRDLANVPQKNLMLRDVSSIKYRFMESNRVWSKSWSPRAIGAIPIAIEMILTMNNGVKYLHLFPIVQQRSNFSAKAS